MTLEPTKKELTNIIGINYENLLANNILFIPYLLYIFNSYIFIQKLFSSWSVSFFSSCFLVKNEYEA